MEDKKPQNKISNRALEMIMKDVLEGMEELSMRSADLPDSDEIKILHRPQCHHQKTNHPAIVIDFPMKLRRSA